MTETATRGSEHTTILVTREGPVAVIELHRAETLNAFNVLMATELLGALGAIAVDSTVRAVVLTGAGRGFSSGLDLISSGLPTLPSGRPDARSALLELFNPLVLTLREMPQPVVAAVNGVAAGIGASVALACDLVLAARSASLLFAFVNVGLVPDGGSTVLVSARAGIGRALEMSLLGEPISAERALEWGLVNRVEDDQHLRSAAVEVAGRLASGPPQANAAIKQLLNAPYLEQLRTQLALRPRRRVCAPAPMRHRPRWRRSPRGGWEQDRTGGRESERATGCSGNPRLPRQCSHHPRGGRGFRAAEVISP